MPRAEGSSRVDRATPPPSSAPSGHLLPPGEKGRKAMCQPGYRRGGLRAPLRRRQSAQLVPGVHATRPRPPRRTPRSRLDPASPARCLLRAAIGGVPAPSRRGTRASPPSRSTSRCADFTAEGQGPKQPPPAPGARGISRPRPRPQSRTVQSGTPSRIIVPSGQKARRIDPFGWARSWPIERTITDARTGFTRPRRPSRSMSPPDRRAWPRTWPE